MKLEDKVIELEATVDALLAAMDPKNINDGDVARQIAALCAKASIRNERRRNTDSARNEYIELKKKIQELELDYSFLKDDTL